MGFEMWLQADASQTRRLPSPSDVESAFAGASIRPSAAGDGTILEIEGETFDLAYDRDVEFVDHIAVDRPTDSQPLWEGMFRLLSDFDMFMYWPGDRLIAAMARAAVPLPADMDAERVIVRSATDLMSLVRGN